ncbi:polysaccharide lyase family 1 protein [Cellulomonas cellasea]|uniref:Pectate lyase n=1 Tax=Cellulomonas cellasea TaxID=43670 RepID=A0A7W4UI42_9CELL|nr:pectate lyase [Cellulomonas cellasea]MBB2924586.1 pectate lyase [Cellulomonas cellasea]
MQLDAPSRPSPAHRRGARLAAVVAAGTVALTTLAVAPAQAADAGTDHRPPHRHGRDLGREVLADNDGWAAANGGTTGGSTADAAHVFTVRTWAELRAALGGTAARTDTTPRIIYVEGTIDAFERDGGVRLTCEDIAARVPVGGDPAVTFSMDDYIAAYDPAVWGRVDPAGPLEEARAAAAALQATETQQHVGSNVTIVGLGEEARIVGANIRVRDSRNVILRNLTFSDAYDCFPQWDPTDGATGNWNSEYDNVTVMNATNVWVANSTFDDGDHPNNSLPEVFGRTFEIHDGMLDVTNSANYVTISYNRFLNHDKTMLIGSSNNRPADVGTLKVTVHHNLFDGIGQRAPRVRYGQVHVYNNLYVQAEDDDDLFEYYWGPGVESSLYVENNAIKLQKGTPVASVLTNWGATRFTEKGTWVNGRPVSVLDAFVAAGGTPFGAEAGWTPTYVERLDPTNRVASIVRKEAGAGRYFEKRS